MWGLRGPWREKGPDRSLAKEASGCRSQRQKERGRVEDSQRGRWGSRANDLSGTEPQGSHGPAENALPHQRQPSTQGPLSQPPDPLPGWLGAESTPGGRNVPAECFSAFPGCKAARSPPAWPGPPSPAPWQGQGTAGSLAWGKASKLRGRVPATHTEVQEEDGGDRGYGAGKRGLRAP